MATTATTTTSDGAEPEELSLVLRKIGELERSEIFQSPDILLSAVKESRLQKALAQSFEFFRAGVRKLLALTRDAQAGLQYQKEVLSDSINLLLTGIETASNVLRACGQTSSAAALLGAKALLEQLQSLLEGTVTSIEKLLSLSYNAVKQIDLSLLNLKNAIIGAPAPAPAPVRSASTLSSN